MLTKIECLCFFHHYDSSIFQSCSHPVDGGLVQGLIQEDRPFSYWRNVLVCFEITFISMNSPSRKEAGSYTYSLSTSPPMDIAHKTKHYHEPTHP
jgi:hypothetical protein